MTSWKHTPIFIRKNKYFFFFNFLGSKCPKLPLNAHFGQQIHALDSILPTVNIESGLKGFLTVCGGQHSKRYQSERQNRQFRESEECVCFQNRGYFTNERDRFLIFNRKTYKNDTLTTSKPSLCCEASFKVPLPSPHSRNQSPIDFN